MWIPIRKRTWNFTSKKDGFDCVKGELISPNYNVHVDFSTCDGLVEII
jgi:hypothetical protein